MKNWYYDKQGKVITDLLEWARLFEDKNYQVVSRYKDERVIISTVWLGIDHNWGNGPPLIFETMVFARSKDIDPKFHNLQWRWTTEEEAKKNHEIIVNCYLENKDPKNI